MEQYRSRMLISAGYIIAVVTAVLAVSDLVMASWPLRFGDVRWRLGAAGFVTTAMPALLTSFFIAGVTAWFLQHRLVLKGFAGLGAGMAVLSAVMLPVFASDFLQVRQLVRAEAMAGFDVTVIRGALVLGVATLAFAWLSYGAWRAAGGGPTPSRKPGRDKKRAPLMSAGPAQASPEA
ncbi:MAG TPA: hypothetical protein VK929_17470 [Longimicrobiales bacterium]|nr:hypothetical protein [Longimicrobiales bacterium]